MAGQWKPYEQALGEVEARLAELLPEGTRRLANLEQLANRHLQDWLADGLIDATAWQLLWTRGHGVSGAGSLGSHYPDGEANLATSGKQTHDGKPIAIPSYWWKMWLSSDDASRDLFHYPHYRGSRRRAGGQGIDWVEPRFFATGAKLSTNGIGECWRVIFLNSAQCAKALSGFMVEAGLAAGVTKARKPGAPPKADYDELFAVAASLLEQQGIDHLATSVASFVSEVMALDHFKQLTSPPSDRTLETHAYTWRRRSKQVSAQ